MFTEIDALGLAFTLTQSAHQDISGKNIDTHRGQRALIPCFGFLGKLNHLILIVGGHNTETIGFFQPHIHHSYGQVSSEPLMKLDHLTIIHLINMVTRKHQHQISAALMDIVQILVDCISGTLIPTLIMPPLVGLKQAYSTLRAIEVPWLTNANMVVQRV